MTNLPSEGLHHPATLYMRENPSGGSKWKLKVVWLVIFWVEVGNYCVSSRQTWITI